MSARGEAKREASKASWETRFPIFAIAYFLLINRRLYRRVLRLLHALHIYSRSTFTSSNRRRGGSNRAAFQSRFCFAVFGKIGGRRVRFGPFRDSTRDQPAGLFRWPVTDHASGIVPFAG